MSSPSVQHCRNEIPAGCPSSRAGTHGGSRALGTRPERGRASEWRGRAKDSAEGGSRRWVCAGQIGGAECVCRPRSAFSRSCHQRCRSSQPGHHPGGAHGRAFGRASHRAAIHVVVLALHLRRRGHGAVGGWHGRCRSGSNGQGERKPQHGKQASHAPPIGRSGT